MYCRYAAQLFQTGMKVRAGHSLAAFNSLCFGFGTGTLPCTNSDNGIRYMLSAGWEWVKSKCFGSDSKRWRSECSVMLAVGDWIKWHWMRSTCAWTWHCFERVISYVSHRDCIRFSRTSLCVAQMVWTKYYFGGLRGVPVHLIYLPVEVCSVCFRNMLHYIMCHLEVSCTHMRSSVLHVVLQHSTGYQSKTHDVCMTESVHTATATVHRLCCWHHLRFHLPLPLLL